MAIHRVDTNVPTCSATDVRIYLDDVEELARVFEPDAPVVLRLLRRDAPDSVFDEVDDLRGRTDVSGIRISSRAAKVEIGPFNVVASVHRSTPLRFDDVQFSLDSLERIQRSWYSRTFFPRQTIVDLVLDRRLSAVEQRAKRRHDVKLLVIGAVLGAVLSAVGTALAGLF
jgi:hypothetical protein